VGTRGQLMVEHARPDHLSALMDKLEHMNVRFNIRSNGIFVDASHDMVKPVDVDTQPHPGFPTDLQAQIMAVLTQVEGDALLTENIFENRFMHVPELLRMGADITLKGANARVRGVKRLKGAPVMATDLRASVSLVMAGLAGRGTTIVRRVYHLDRGYEAIEKKLRPCGALIERFSED
jgi:UDP-N-acetylglucosamine enolpyruvyl transferase